MTSRNHDARALTTVVLDSGYAGELSRIDDSHVIWLVDTNHNRRRVEAIWDSVSATREHLNLFVASGDEETQLSIALELIDDHRPWMTGTD